MPELSTAEQERLASFSRRAGARRLRRLGVSDVLLLEQFKRGTDATEVVANPLPADAELVGIQFDPFYGRVELLIHSNEYDEAQEGALPPWTDDPVFRRR